MRKKTIIGNVTKLCDKAPEITDDYRTLLMCYWKFIDKIDIPDNVIKEIVTRGTKPETISRSLRKATEVNAEEIKEKFLKLIEGTK